MNKITAIFIVSFLIGCSNLQNSANDGSNEQTLTQKQEISATCSVYESRKWHAWLDKYTEHEGLFRLIVVGEVDLSSQVFSWNSLWM